MSAHNLLGLVDNRKRKKKHSFLGSDPVQGKVDIWITLNENVNACLASATVLGNTGRILWTDKSFIFRPIWNMCSGNLLYFTRHWITYKNLYCRSCLVPYCSMVGGNVDVDYLWCRSPSKFLDKNFGVCDPRNLYIQVHLLGGFSILRSFILCEIVTKFLITCNLSKVMYNWMDLVF